MNRFFTLFFSASCLTAVAQVPDYVSADGLISWHNLNGNAIDELGGHDGTLEGSFAVPNRQGEEGAALGFNDGDYAELGTYSEIQGLCEFSTSIWFFGLEEQGSGCCNMLWCSGYNQYLLNLGTWDPQLHFDSGLGCASDIASTTHDGQLYGEWHHAVAQLVDGNLELWLDGFLVSTSPHSSCVCGHNYKMTLATMDGFPHHLNGYLDEFGVWNRALSAEEILQLYLAAPPVFGCMDEEACNFDEAANVDDSSCSYEGCNDPEACNFNGADICSVDCIYPAVGDDCSGGEGLCGEGTYWSASSQSCLVAVPGDFDYDGCINVNDLLGQLAVYNLCFDLSEIAFDCGLDNVSYHGYNYSTVQIGDQCWFAENLRTPLFTNADSIPAILGIQDWLDAGVTLPGRVRYGEGEGAVYEGSSDEVANGQMFGNLYNQGAVQDDRGICPTGWRVPTQMDWEQLGDHLGGAAQAGGRMKTTNSVQGGLGAWVEPNVAATNASGFSALPGGFRVDLGWYSWQGLAARWWSTTEVNGKYVAVNVLAGSSELGQIELWPSDGNSVRCLKD